MRAVLREAARRSSRSSATVDSACPEASVDLCRVSPTRSFRRRGMPVAGFPGLSGRRFFGRSPGSTSRWFAGIHSRVHVRLPTTARSRFTASAGLRIHSPHASTISAASLRCSCRTGSSRASGRARRPLLDVIVRPMRSFASGLVIAATVLFAFRLRSPQRECRCRFRQEIFSSAKAAATCS